jgi:hypothetical protein
MTATLIGIITTALAIQIDRITQFKHHVLPIIALGGVVTAVISFTL